MWNSLILSRNRSFYSETYYSFYPDFLQCDEMDFSEWKQWLLSASRTGTWLAEATYTSMDYSSPYAAITYARIWPATISGNQNVYYATLRTDKLMYMLADEEILSGGYVHITDINGNILLQQDAVPYGDASCESFREVSEQTGISVELGIPRSYLQAQMAPLERFLRYILPRLSQSPIAMVVIFPHTAALRLCRKSFIPCRSRTFLFLRRIRNSSQKARSVPPSGSGVGKIASSISYLDRQLSTHAEMIKRKSGNCAISSSIKRYSTACMPQKIAVILRSYFPISPATTGWLC